VAHACNPSYSGGSDQEDHSFKPAQAPYLEKKLSQKRAGGVAQGTAPKFKLQYLKKIQIKKPSGI
jgi:hypothetical protein